MRTGFSLVRNSLEVVSIIDRVSIYRAHGGLLMNLVFGIDNSKGARKIQTLALVETIEVLNGRTFA